MQRIQLSEYTITDKAYQIQSNQAPRATPTPIRQICLDKSLYVMPKNHTRIYKTKQKTGKPQVCNFQKAFTNHEFIFMIKLFKLLQVNYEGSSAGFKHQTATLCTLYLCTSKSQYK